jgi:hypothetical protein
MCCPREIPGQDMYEDIFVDGRCAKANAPSSSSAHPWPTQPRFSHREFSPAYYNDILSQFEVSSSTSRELGRAQRSLRRSRRALGVGCEGKGVSPKKGPGARREGAAGLWRARGDVRGKPQTRKPANQTGAFASRAQLVG